jgi:hypothetical protein
MSDLPTPETDANEAWPASKLKLGDDGVVPAEFARRLEQERDEARAAMREAWLAMDEIDGTDRMVKWQNKHANI